MPAAKSKTKFEVQTQARIEDDEGEVRFVLTTEGDDAVNIQLQLNNGSDGWENEDYPRTLNLHDLQAAVAALGDK